MRQKYKHYLVREYSSVIAVTGVGDYVRLGPGGSVSEPLDTYTAIERPPILPGTRVLYLPSKEIFLISAVGWRNGAPLYQFVRSFWEARAPELIILCD